MSPVFGAVAGRYGSMVNLKVAMLAE